MPTALNIVFEPLRAFRSAIAPTDVHRLACYLIEDRTIQAHEMQLKPFSVSPVMLADDIDDVVGTRPDALMIRLSSLDDHVDALSRVEHFGRQRPNLGLEHPLRLVDIGIEHQSMAELASGPASGAVHVEFCSPTHFSRNGRRYSLPDPVLACARLVERWNAVSDPEAPWFIDSELTEQIVSTVVLSGCRVETVGNGRRPDGFIGAATYQLLRHADSTTQHAFASLWRFARYSGVGALTTQGFGCVEVRLPGGQQEEENHFDDEHK